jgi:hypothetical protein
MARWAEGQVLEQMGKAAPAGLFPGYADAVP